MDTEVKTSKPVEMSRPRRRVRWLPAVVLLAVVGLMAAGAFWAMRPRWRTYTSSVLKGTNLALQVDFPNGWQTTSSKYPSEADRGDMVLAFTRTPPTGITRWWYERVLRQKVGTWSQYRVESVLSLRSSQKELRDREALERSMKELSALSSIKSSSIKVVTRRFSHPLGPALEVEVTLSGSNVPSTVIQSGDMHLVAIFPEDTLEHRKVAIGMTYQAPPGQLPQIRPTFDEIVRRVRLVDKK